MSEPGPEPEPAKLLEACPHCATLIDVSEEEAFGKIHCPSCGGAMRVRRQFNQFQVLEEIGQGGMGTVYKAFDLNLSRNVALKVLKKEYGEDDNSVRELEREAKITASISHPHVVKVYSVGRAHEQFYIAMELVEKGSLDELMHLQNRVGEVQMLTVGIQIAQGLEAAYAKGLIHSDIKPGNILFADAQTAKIVDFGLAVLMQEEAEEKGEIWGTPYYVSPERLNKEPEDFRSDIYSLGGTLFHALAGRPPFEALTASLVALKHVKSKAVSLQAFAPNVSSETAYVINRMLMKDPADRYSSYAELIEHLTYARDKIAESSGGAAVKKERVVVETEQSKLLGGLMALGLLAAIGVVVTMAVLFWPKSDKSGAEVTSVGGREPGLLYKDARAQMLRGEFADAQLKFQQIGNEGKAKQPLQNWIVLHEGLAALLAGNAQASRAVFARLEKEGIYSRDPADLRLGSFFAETGRTMAKPDPLPSSMARIYSATNEEALALFLFALKDWHQEAYEPATALFKAFIGGKMQPPNEWIEEYKPIAQRYYDDLAKLAGLQSAAESAKNVDEMKRVAGEAKDARAKLRSGDKLDREFLELLARLEQRIKNPNLIKIAPTPAAATPTPKPTPTPPPKPTPPPIPPEVVAQERARLQAIGTALRKAAATLDPQPLVQQIDAFKPRSPEAAGEAKALAQKAAWLAAFKRELIAGLNTKGYPDPVKRRDGVVLEGKVGRADEAGIEIKIPYGSIPLRWAEVSPLTILAMAARIEDAGGSPPAEKKWNAGVYAMAVGLEAQGRALLLEASQLDPQLRSRLDVFFASQGPGT